MQEFEESAPPPATGGLTQIAHVIGGFVDNITDADALAMLRDSLGEIISAAQTGQETPAHSAVWQELPADQLPEVDVEDGGIQGAGLGDALSDVVDRAHDVAAELAAASGVAPLLGQLLTTAELQPLDSSEPVVEAMPDEALDTDARSDAADARSVNYSGIDAASTTDPDDVVPIAGVVQNPNSPAADAAATDTDDDVIEATEADEPADLADEPVTAEAEGATDPATTD